MFKLVIMPDGRSLLAYSGNLSKGQVDQIQEAWKLWRESEPGSAPLVASGCEVVQVRDIELAIESDE